MKLFTEFFMKGSLCKAPFLFVLLFCSLPLPALSSADNSHAEKAVHEARELRLSDNREWHRLLYYRKNVWGSLESQMDGPSFFVSGQGKTDPAKELEALLVGILTEDPNQPEESSLQCRFPVRSEFLKKNLQGKVTWPAKSCPRFEKWFETVRGESVSIVFSSYYLNNPSSMFGHTFLRINKAPSAKTGQRYELLDYGVNFAANPTTENPIGYALLGLTGGFPGVFTTMPYYYKVREYNNAESRDLWQYELNLPPGTADRLMRHVWEVGPSWADYWYLTENCSYFILAVIEAVTPDLDIVDHLKKYVIPGDTIQAIWATPGLVKNVTFRPSTRSELYARLKDLNDDEKKWVAETVDHLQVQPQFQNFSQDRQRLALDAAIDHMDYRYAYEVQFRDKPQGQFKNQLLAMRSRIPQVTEPLRIDPPQDELPHMGHGSRRISVGGFDSKEKGTGFSLQYKFALHDFLDPSTGYPDYAEITFFDFGFEYMPRENKFDFTRLMLFEVTSLVPRSRFSKSLSWNLHVGAERLQHEDCFDCLAGTISGGAGRSAVLWPNSGLIGYLGVKGLVAYTGSGGESQTPNGRDFPRVLLGAGPHGMIKSRLSSQWIAFLEGWYRRDLQVENPDAKEVSLALQWNPSKDWGVRATGVERWFEKRASLDFSYYY